MKTEDKIKVLQAYADGQTIIETNTNNGIKTTIHKRINGDYNFVFGNYHYQVKKQPRTIWINKDNENKYHASRTRADVVLYKVGMGLSDYTDPIQYIELTDEVRGTLAKANIEFE